MRQRSYLKNEYPRNKRMCIVTEAAPGLQTLKRGHEETN